MSGGHFDYAQFRITEIYDSVQKAKERNEYDFTNNTLDEFDNGIYILKKAHIYAQRIDWLLSYDDSEVSFHERLKEELAELDEWYNKQTLKTIKNRTKLEM